MRVVERNNKLLVGSPRVLDLTDEKGVFCGRILADLGADVIKIEKPGGDQSRNIGPFYHDVPDDEKSLYWFVFNANKRGITLNLETEDGKKIFKKLVESADFVVESFPPGHMDKLGLAYSVISEINPRIIMTSITPFGQTGPYREFKASDIVCIALSGWMYRMGDPDRAPVRVSLPQAYLNAGGEAAVGSMIAYYYRERTGKGQHVDVSIRESLVPNAQQTPAIWESNRVLLKRVGPFLVGISREVKLRMTWQCKDGFVVFILMGGLVGAATNRNIVDWMDSEGMANDFLKGFNWEAWDMAKVTQEEIDQIEEPISNLFMTHTKAELYNEALKRRILLTPVSTPKDIIESPQLQAREFWVKVEHSELRDTITYPGIPIKAGEIDNKIERRAPLIGEHNLEVYEGELGLTREELLILKQSGVI